MEKVVCYNITVVVYKLKHSESVSKLDTQTVKLYIHTYALDI